MSQAVLKQSIGDGGAATDSSHSPPGGPSRLYDVLKQLARPRPFITAIQASVAVAVLARVPVTVPDTLRELSVRLDVCGTVGATTVQVRVNTVVVGTVTIDNAAADPTTSKVTLGTGGAGIDVKEGDLVDINVSAAPTGGTGLAVSVTSGGVSIEA
jgi:hypothetical protein